MTTASYLVTPAVVEVRVTDAARAFFTISCALAGAKTGTHVRVMVGRLSPPPWIAEQLPPGMTYQVVAETAQIANEWQTMIGATS